MQKSILTTIFIFITCFSFSTANAQNWEVRLLDGINPQTPSSAFWQKTSSTTYAVAVGVPATQLIAGFIKKDKKLQRQGWETVGTLAINTVITQGLKYTLQRDRPYEKYPLIIHPYEIASDKSFPSGHTSTAFALATSLAVQYKKWYVAVPAYAWAASVGYSRLYLGEHYPTDVIAGAAIGAGSAWLSHYLNKKLLGNKRK